MKQKLFLIVLLIFSINAFSQNNEIKKIVSDSLNDVNFEVRLYRIASEYFEEGEIVQISAQFKIDSEGNLFDVKARGPMAALENHVVSKLKNIVIPKKIVADIEVHNPDLIFALPIRFQVKSNSEILKLIRKDKRRKVKEERRKARKN